jgi:hypothetical protein
VTNLRDQGMWPIDREYLHDEVFVAQHLGSLEAAIGEALHESRCRDYCRNCTGDCHWRLVFSGEMKYIRETVCGFCLTCVKAQGNEFVKDANVKCSKHNVPSKAVIQKDLMSWYDWKEMYSAAEPEDWD